MERKARKFRIVQRNFIPMHECEIRNEELNESCVIYENLMFIYDSQDEFMIDFDVNFCPKCGKNLDDLPKNKIEQT